MLVPRGDFLLDLLAHSDRTILLDLSLRFCVGEISLYHVEDEAFTLQRSDTTAYCRDIAPKNANLPVRKLIYREPVLRLEVPPIWALEKMEKER